MCEVVPLELTVMRGTCEAHGAMPVTKSPNPEVSGTDSSAVCPSNRRLVSIGEPLETGQDETFAERPQTD